MSHDTDRIRTLNDNLRQNLFDGHAVITPGIAELGAEAFVRLAKTIAIFDDFHHANDPHEEHDFGSFDFEGVSVIFKVEYYDKSLTFHSLDPANPAVTERIITIMRADEY